MTVSYQYDVASSSTGGFFRLLWRWRGSIWKLLYKELLLFIAIYLCIAFSYDFLMTDYYKRYYERIVIFCSAFVEIIPLSFILGFYVSFTATRWWQQYTAIPWPDKLMNIIALYVPGNDVTSRVLRRTLMRYLNLTLVLVLRSISIPVKRRFPTKEHLVDAGFMSRPELEMYSSVPSHEFNTFWIPCTWFVNLLREAKSECRITDSGGIKLIMEEFNEFRSKCGLLWSYDWVSIPLVYTQVVTLSTQAFFLASLLGRQHINPPKDQDIKSHVYGEYYIPIFTVLQFILYMGLLKLGEQLINPFGDDDEDFELNWIIDRHLKVSFLGVDILNSDPPPLIKDNYFDDMDIKLPYTEAAVAHKVKTYRGSVAAFHVPAEKHGLVIPEFEDDNGENTDDEAPSTIQSNRDATIRNSSWSLFGRKRKLSSSIDSFNSETMVETGLDETEIPQIPPNSSWSTFLVAEAEQNTESKLGVWPYNIENQKANEDTQGIRGTPNKETEVCAPAKNVPIPPVQFQWNPVFTSSQPNKSKASENELVKQSSFSTSDSSIVIPLSDDSDRRSSSNSTSRFFGFRKYPLQVFSKEFANAPISVFNELAEVNSKPSGDRQSVSSLSLKPDKPPKPHKSLIKCHRTIDPKLKIRPFRSKVTFSEDTKDGDNSGGPRNENVRYNFFSKWDSSSDSVASILKTDGERISLKQPMFYNSSSLVGQNKSVNETPFVEFCKRRQSLDPTLYLAKNEEVTKENWLHYQSLPNIQEEEQQPTSPTETSSTHDQTIGSRETILLPSVSKPSETVTEKPVIPKVTTQPTLTSSTSLLSPQSSMENPRSPITAKRRSIKRQKSQEISDEDLKLQKLPPPPPKMKISQVKKQSSDESQTSSMTDNSTCSNQLKGPYGTMGFVPTSILRRRKEDLKPRQASTESDTGSYHTVNSFLMQIEKSNSSSIDSFTSAVSESNNNSNSNNADITSKEEHPEQDRFINGNRLLSSFTGIESSLVPTIIFSQSTPSVTSQSSDDQSSPKWDERYPEFSSVETVTEVPRRTNQPTNNFHFNPLPYQESSSSFSGMPSLVTPTPLRPTLSRESLQLNITDLDRTNANVETHKEIADHPPESISRQLSSEIAKAPNNIGRTPAPKQNLVDLGQRLK